MRKNKRNFSAKRHFVAALGVQSPPTGSKAAEGKQPFGATTPPEKKDLNFYRKPNHWMMQRARDGSNDGVEKKRTDSVCENGDEKPRAPKQMDKESNSVLFDKSLFENEINRKQIVNFIKIYHYRDIKFYMNIYQDFKKSDIIEISSYWMGILDGPIRSRYQDYDLTHLLDSETFRHNLKFCLVLFVYNPHVEQVVREKIEFPLIVYPLKKFSYFTNETDLLFEWNERMELFTVGYEFDVTHYIEKVPAFFKKNWLIFENDFPLRLSDFCCAEYGRQWRELLREKYNVYVTFLNCDSREQTRKAYELCFRMYKQCIYYKSFDETNVERYNSNWYYECFTNGTPILTTDDSDFAFFDFFEVSYNLRWRDGLENDPEGVCNMFNTKNIQKMSSLIFRWKSFVLDTKNDIVEYFRNIHYNLFKMQKNYPGKESSNNRIDLLCG